MRNDQIRLLVFVLSFLLLNALPTSAANVIYEVKTGKITAASTGRVRAVRAGERLLVVKTLPKGFTKTWRVDRGKLVPPATRK